MPVNTSYKPSLTLQEQDELLQWFNDNMERLPERLTMPGIDVPNLKETARRMVRHLRICKENKTYFGQYALLKHLRQMSEQAWAESATTQEPTN